MTKHLLAMLMLGVLLVLSAPISAEPAFWRAEGPEGRRLYLLGAIHVGSPHFYPMRQVIESAFRGADTLAVELDILTLDAQYAARFTQLLGMAMPQAADSPANGSQLSDPLRRQLTDYCEAQSLCPPAALRDQMKPWLLALHITQQLLASGPYQSALGVDRHFLARRGQRGLLQLESFESQLRAFDGLPLVTQELLLTQALIDPQAASIAVGDLVAAWRAGDNQALEDLVLSPMRNSAQALPMYQWLMVARNHAMVERLLAAVNAQETVFVVIGAGHLIGDEGLVALLSSRGYSVKRL